MCVGTQICGDKVKSGIIFNHYSTLFVEIGSLNQSQHSSIRLLLLAACYSDPSIWNTSPYNYNQISVLTWHGCGFLFFFKSNLFACQVSTLTTVLFTEPMPVILRLLYIYQIFVCQFYSSESFMINYRIFTQFEIQY